MFLLLHHSAAIPSHLAVMLALLIGSIGWTRAGRGLVSEGDTQKVC